MHTNSTNHMAGQIAFGTIMLVCLYICRKDTVVGPLYCHVNYADNDNNKNDHCRIHIDTTFYCSTLKSLADTKSVRDVIELRFFLTFKHLIL